MLRRMRFRLAGSLTLCGVWVLLSSGCHWECEEPLSRTETTLSEASLSTFWSAASHKRMTLVVTDLPYRAADAAVNQLVAVLRDQAGIEATVVEGGDTGLVATGILSWRDVVSAGIAVAPATTDPVMVITKVSGADYPTATYGFVDWNDESVAVMCVYRDAAQTGAVWPVTPEVIETLTVVHEAGHWLGVPARDNHISSVDAVHCTNARCVMYSGGRLGPCGIFANLLTGIPQGFGPSCAEELAEMRSRRERLISVSRASGASE